MNVEILRYEKKYKNYFKKLNLEWLQKYFEVEPVDEQILSNPEKIIKNGGEIFFAKLNNIVVGTCALEKIDNETFELIKMGVTEKAQGKKIGELLSKSAVEFAKSQKAKRIILESNRKLIAALSLYKKLGFVEVPDYVSSKYIRSNIKMILELDKENYELKK